ncbi:hypothetical protein D3C76_501460 [compost metagenome]
MLLRIGLISMAGSTHGLCVEKPQSIPESRPPGSLTHGNAHRLAIDGGTAGN